MGKDGLQQNEALELAYEQIQTEPDAALVIRQAKSFSIDELSAEGTTSNEQASDKNSLSVLEEMFESFSTEEQEVEERKQMAKFMEQFEEEVPEATVDESGQLVDGADVTEGSK